MNLKTKLSKLSEYYKIFKDKPKISIIVIVESTKSLYQLDNYLNNIPYSFSINFIVIDTLVNELKKFQNKIKYVSKLFIYTQDTNQYIPFFKVLDNLNYNNISLACILTIKNTERKEWFDLTFKSLLGSKNTVFDIIKQFEISSIKFMSIADFYISSNKKLNSQQLFMGRLMLKIGEKNLTKEWGIFSENIFWIKKDLILLLLAHKEFFTDNNLKDCDYNLSSLNAICNLLAKKNGMDIGLRYAIDYKREYYKTKIVDDSITYHQFDTDIILNHQKELNNNYNTIKESSIFNIDYYIENTPLVNELEMDAILHFLRYGIFINQAPNKSFSPFNYISIYRNSFNGGINSLSDFIVNPKRVLIPVTIDFMVEKKIIIKSDLFDIEYYKSENKDIDFQKIDSLSHYCSRGWQEDRKPNSKFDSIWYKSEYLKDYLTPINPLLHYILIGEKRGYKIRPTYKVKNKIYTYNFPTKPKRVTLFAGYDKDGIIDKYVIYFIKQLSRFSDVYYLCDYNLKYSELKKLKEYTKGAWGFCHGEYDFGSYKRLANNLIGWENIKKYDEVMLINDSSYLLKPLDDVFDKMNKKSCSWWGLQASKGIYQTKDIESNQYKNKIYIDLIKESYLLEYEEDDIYDFHIGSYFLAFREPLIKGNILRDILNSVKKEKNKKNIILNYEIGTTRKLINMGYEFDTYMDFLYKFHPLYTNNIFSMIDDGFPIFKRFLLTKNHYQTLDLWKWKKNILNKFPQTNIEIMENNLYRIIDKKTINEKRFFYIDPEFTYQISKERNNGIPRVYKDVADKNPVDKNMIFFESALGKQCRGNPKALYKYIKTHYPTYKLVWCLDIDNNPFNDDLDTKIVKRATKEYYTYLALSKYVIIDMTLPIWFLREDTILLQTWHGTPLKKMHWDRDNIEAETATNHIFYNKSKGWSALISANSFSTKYLKSAFKYDGKILETGYPANDIFFNQELEAKAKEKIYKKYNLNNSKKIILYAPTWRDYIHKGDYNFEFNIELNIEKLMSYLGDNIYFLIRMHHMSIASEQYLLNTENIINVSEHDDVHEILTVTNLLITDYSSIMFDFACTKRPIINYIPDYNEYLNYRGMYFDLKTISAGNLCYDEESLKSKCIELLKNSNYLNDNYKKFYNKFSILEDGNSSKRVIEYLFKI